MRRPLLSIKDFCIFLWNRRRETVQQKYTALCRRVYMPHAYTVHSTNNSQYDTLITSHKTHGPRSRTLLLAPWRSGTAHLAGTPAAARRRVVSRVRGRPSSGAVRPRNSESHAQLAVALAPMPSCGRHGGGISGGSAPQLSVSSPHHQSHQRRPRPRAHLCEQWRDRYC